MKNVKFLLSSAGSYGVAHEGDELVLKDYLAGQLEKQGTVKILGDAASDAQESVASKGTIRLAQDKKEEKAYTKEKDEKQHTPEKVSKAGPNAPKKK